ncbi:hypothetical protein GS506_19090 [Rhodococcus hoagii]|nr:hypothetical protein [Prescottella equi]
MTIPTDGRVPGTLTRAAGVAAGNLTCRSSRGDPREVPKEIHRIPDPKRPERTYCLCIRVRSRQRRTRRRWVVSGRRIHRSLP